MFSQRVFSCNRIPGTEQMVGAKTIVVGQRACVKISNGLWIVPRYPCTTLKMT